MLYAVVRSGEVIDGIGGATLVPWWSFTKTVIAAAALTLVHDGALGLDTEVAGERYTLRHLLQHRAGLCDYGELPEYDTSVARGDRPWSPAEMLERADARRLRYEPGQGWGYSNIGYLMAVRLIEEAAGAPLDSVLKHRVLQPLGIGETRLAVNPADLSGVEMGETRNYDPGWVYHGLLVGPLSEAALLLDRLLGGPLLSPHLLAQMHKGHPVDGVEPGRPWQQPAYGLGLMIETPGGPVGHTGGGPGSSVAVYRSRTEHPRAAAVFAAGNRAGDLECSAFARL